MAEINITTPKGGKTFGKIVPRQENSNLKRLGWSRTIIYWNHHSFFMIFLTCASFVKCYSILHFRFDELLLSKGKPSLQSDDAVVNQMDIHQLASLLNLAGQCQVSLGGRGPTQRMIMRNYN